MVTNPKRKWPFNFLLLASTVLFARQSAMGETNVHAWYVLMSEGKPIQNLEFTQSELSFGDPSPGKEPRIFFTLFGKIGHFRGSLYANGNPVNLDSSGKFAIKVPLSGNDIEIKCEQRNYKKTVSTTLIKVSVADVNVIAQNVRPTEPVSVSLVRATSEHLAGSSSPEIKTETPPPFSKQPDDRLPDFEFFLLYSLAERVISPGMGWVPTLDLEERIYLRFPTEFWLTKKIAEGIGPTFNLGAMVTRKVKSYYAEAGLGLMINFGDQLGFFPLIQLAVGMQTSSSSSLFPESFFIGFRRVLTETSEPNVFLIGAQYSLF